MRPAVAVILVMLAAGAAHAADVVRPAARLVPATPAPALALAGYGEIGIGTTRLRAETNGFTVDNLRTDAGGAYFNLPLGARWNIEVEGRGYRVDWTGGSSASDAGTFVHAYWRDPQHFVLGGFAGQTALTLYGMQGTMRTAGAEALAYLGGLTLYGQAAWYKSTTSAGWLYFTGHFLRGTARVFATPNLRLQIDAQWASIDNSDHTAALSLVGTAEYRVSNWPLAAFARVRWDRLTPVVNQPYSTSTVLIGIRGYFGSGSLIDNDRRGAPLDVLPFPPLYALNFG